MTTKLDCFMIMPIDNSATEHLWGDVYFPVIQESGFNPYRIDKREDGSDLSPQIMQNIISAALIIADLTVERQNCYYELGFAHGIHIGEPARVIVCCREDHYSCSSNYKYDGPKVHFDLVGRNIIWWHPDKINKFKVELKEKIELRMKHIEQYKKKQETEKMETLQKPDLSLLAKDDSINQLEKRLEQAQREMEKHE